MPYEATNWSGRIVSDRYEVHERIGDGGMAFVYRAYDKRLQIDVALKVPRLALLEQKGFVQRFQREILSLVQLHHPHIVQVLDLGEDDGHPYAVMRYLKGGNLQGRRKRIEKGRSEPKPPNTLFVWLPQIADALDFVHHRGYVHRDVKPGNILFDETGRPYLTDFGIIKAIGDKTLAESYEQTPTDLVFGTPAYMAPELCQGKTVDGRSDQYSLAVAVYEWLAGQQPISGETPLAVLTNQSMATPTPLYEHSLELSPSICEAVARGLSKNPDDRFENCTAFANAVTADLDAVTQSKLSKLTVGVPLGESTQVPQPDQGTTRPYSPHDAAFPDADPETQYQELDTKHGSSEEDTDQTGTGDEERLTPVREPESPWSAIFVGVFLISLLAFYVWQVGV